MKNDNPQPPHIATTIRNNGIPQPPDNNPKNTYLFSDKPTSTGPHSQLLAGNTATGFASHFKCQHRVSTNGHAALGPSVPTQYSEEAIDHSVHQLGNQ